MDFISVSKFFQVDLKKCSGFLFFALVSVGSFIVFHSSFLFLSYTFFKSNERSEDSSVGLPDFFLFFFQENFIKY